MRLLLLLVVSFCLLACSGSPTRTRDLKGARYYIVEAGDTLYSVGFRTGFGYKKIARWNGIRSPYKLSVGKKLKLYSPSKKKSKWKKPVKKKGTKKKSTKKKPAVTYSTKLKKLYWRWPVKGRVIDGFSGTDKKGINIAGKVGRKIRAAESGVVVYSGSSLVGYGRLLIIKHNYLYLSAYAQNRRLLVKEGQKVKRGQVIAEMGVGVSAKPLLHFEIRRNGNPVNPMKYLPR
ncbi:MAG: peptidoglycan DD-metalloendopeptidase family protein [Methyloprofundus sp.]|nr:peptidoglycan DD-metalloendopeptidase family protein [Methyloprofundus sp.]